jgi:hypothetical protein
MNIQKSSEGSAAAKRSAVAEGKTAAESSAAAGNMQGDL